MTRKPMTVLTAALFAFPNVALANVTLRSQAGPAAIVDARGSTQVDDLTLRMARDRIKHVFVLYQENRSFDSYFGTFPGADGLYSRSAAQTPGFANSP